MMKLSAKSKFVRWTYLLSRYPPMRTSLCAIFWRGVIFMPLLAIVIVTALIVLLILLIQQWQDTLMVFGFLSGLAGLIYGLSYYVGYRRSKIRQKRESGYIREPTIIELRIKAYKEKMCPIIEIVDLIHDHE